MTGAELKAQARAQLGGGIFKNEWLTALAVCFIAMAICSAAGGLLPGIGALILSGPMTYGVAYVFLKQSRDGQPMNVADVFRGFPEDFGGTLLLGLLSSLFSFALSTSVIIFIDIVLYVISDLKRYNTLDQNYKQYDQESDNRYMYLLSDFRIYTIMIIFVFILSIPLSAIYGEESQKWSGILVSCLCAVVGIVLVVHWVKHKSKEEIKRILLKVGGKIAEWMFVALLCFTISAIFIVNNKATISVSYNADGIVEICNTSAENYNGLDIEIWNMDGEKIYTESVEKEKLLFAREDKYVNNEVEGEKVAEGILINSECLYWKYMFDLKEVINESGEYCVSITVYQDGKSAFLINSLSVENKEYIFAKDSMEKDY